MPRQWDIVVYGATGFTGRQTATYLAEKAPPGLRLAIAGRNEDGLRALQQTLGRPNVGVICANSDDAASVDAMVASTRVLATTAGPFALYGTPVVEACVRHGTHYCDITGETPWVRDMIDAHHETAKAAGTRIVPLCGFDSIPADMGTWALIQHFQATQACLPRRVKGWYRLRGGLNGGTLASALNLNASGEVRRLARPFLLSPGHQPTPEEKTESRDPRQALRDPHWGWCTPFVMGAVNTRVVRRTAFLLAGGARAYQPGFTYQEYQGSGGGRSRWAARRDVMVLGSLLGLMSQGWGRAILKSVGPKPGRGPGQKTIETGGFRLDLVAEGDDGHTLWGTVKGQGDPSNTITVTCLAESALCLALEEGALPSGGGVLTPAVAFGDVLLKRLEGTCLTVSVGLEAPHS